jgi:hypothetical protein
MGAASMTTKKPESRGRIQVPSEPIDPELLPGDVDQATAENMIAGLSPEWVEAPDLRQFSGYILDLVHLAEYGNSWKADQIVREHPRGQQESLVNDLRAVADAQIRKYVKARKKNKTPIDPSATAYLARHPTPLRRSRGRKASDHTAYETLKLAAQVKLQIDAGKSVEAACQLVCEPCDTNYTGQSRASRAYYAYRNTPEIELMATLLIVGREHF